MFQLLVPTSVNFFFSRACNYSCKYCFHTEQNAFLLDIGDMKRGLRLLQVAGMRKIRIHPRIALLYADTVLGPLVEYCKETLALESVSVVSNGSRVGQVWFERFGRYVDILAISCLTALAAP